MPAWRTRAAEDGITEGGITEDGITEGGITEGGITEGGITEGVIWKTILRFFFPVLLSTFFQQMYNTVDAMVVGRFVGKAALAAVGGSTGQIINLVVGFFMGVASGATVILAQYYGAKDREKVSRTVHTTAVFALVGGAVIMVGGMLASPAVLRMLGTPEDVMPHAVSYITIYFAGMVPSLIYNIGSGLLRAVGDFRRPLVYLIVACVINTVLDLWMVRGLGMGVAGAAWATVISQAASAVLVVRSMMKTHDMYRLQVRSIRADREMMGRIVRIGLPAGLQPIMYSFTNILLQAAINGFGTDIAAAYTAYSKLDVYYWMFANALSISVTTFVGQNFGARQYGRLKKGRWLCMAMSLAASSLLSVLFVLLGRPLLALFTADADVLDYGVRIIALMVPLYVLYGLNEVTVGTLRGVGDSLMPTVITFFGVCLTRVVWLLWVVPVHHTLEVLLRCFPVSWVLTTALLGLYDLFGGWLKRAVRRAGTEDSCI